ncbi:MAG: molybdopterin molybdotransferase MoeA [Planctomycetaceae bacterium]|nr:molybdopterin molybdotransferase MoeA [Planctomycetaceae bacterium]
MLSVDEALKLVLDHARPLSWPQSLTIGDGEALGCVLTERVTSDIDSPPHDKSIVDGYALIAADAEEPGRELTVIEEVTAGAVPTRTVERGTATRIMTGAPLPAGADAVVKVEQTTLAGDRVRIHQSPVKPGQNIMRQGASLKRGQVVLEPGKVLRPIEIGLLAEVGRDSVEAIRRPLVAVIPTGNELVPSSQTPGRGQIRNSNGPMLRALAESAGARAHEYAIVRDDPDQLRMFVLMGLGSRIILLSGGVSAGVLDLVPGVLRDLGVQEVFHKVNLKPGKPLWFGVKDEAQTQTRTLVFGLPGNPVSGLVCFELFVRPAIEKLSGREPKGLPRVTATLTQEHKQRGDRPTYWPALLAEIGDQKSVTPLPWQGSGDLRTLTDANCLAYFPAGDRVFAAGERFETLILQ